MKVETKYGIGEEYYFLGSNKKIQKMAISSVAIFVSEKTSINYSMGAEYTGESVQEDSLFKTKEELIKSLD